MPQLHTYRIFPLTLTLKKEGVRQQVMEYLAEQLNEIAKQGWEVVEILQQGWNVVETEAEVFLHEAHWDVVCRKAYRSGPEGLV